MLTNSATTHTNLTCSDAHARAAPHPSPYTTGTDGIARDSGAEAVAAYEDALQELRREDKPFAWAMTRANLGDARRGLAEREQDTTMSHRAVADFEAVAEVFHSASHPQYYELAKERLAVARELAARLSA